MLLAIKQWLVNKRLVSTAFYGYLAVVFIITLIPTDEFNDSSWLDDIIHFDKIAHILIFLGFTILYYFYLDSKKWVLLLCIPFSAGIIIEILQHVLPTNRSFDVYDIIADLIGVTIALLIIKIQKQNKIYN